jgi:hypothetical protein
MRPGILLRKTPLGSILDTWPCKVLFYDRQVRIASRSTYNLFQMLKKKKEA